ncbi:acetyl-CoA carboxylase biotin carboxyl carrier protein [Staphylococcus capitis]|uniref:acetyl-CoA carboxylase biotin carboxyl carrier protein n=1 Tax=Staphylococcus capitis TaxID=29388 RepID=UPI001F5AF77A|nr:biotin/lipoyl-containing protein [Staphylococcus capitis]MCI2951700.1 acetyl-CoA carboxylase biotin carboxyl carrier protein subunit [Staphylococcus capitis]MDS3980335.1 biotin/lipoyl-containing protein [Staphylococcus capitis]
MNLERIEEIINLVKSNDVKKFKYKDFENEIELDFTEGNSSQGLSQTANVQSNEMTQTNNETQDTNNQTQDSSDDKEIKSSMVGTFFLQDSKELTDPQIKVGDQVKEGDIIGYIEAMKVMNEITSDVSGEVTEIVVEHGINVEYDQVLVKVK